MLKAVAIITTYYPKPIHVENIKRIAKQVDRIIVCDNSPCENKKIFSGITNLIYYCWEQNLGLSMAFNNVLRDDSLDWKEDDFIIFFDQDSKVTDNHVKNLIKEFLFLKEKRGKIGCLGPVFFNNSNQQTEVPKVKEMISENSMKVSSIITSSMLCRYADLKEIGFWNEEIFLDMADWDICWRFQEKGFMCCMTDKSILNHSVGEGEKKVGFIKLRVGKPFREYYQTRDCLYLLKKEYTPFKYKIRFCAMVTIRPLLHILFLDDKRSRVNYIKQGISDYRNDIKGALKQ